MEIAHLEHEGKIIRLKRGLYVISSGVSKQLLSKELIANHLYGPSYVSMESALCYYGLIPEQVLMATPEKALCDLLVATPCLRLQSLKALETYLEEDIRFDTSALEKMDSTVVEQCLITGKKQANLKWLLKRLTR